MKYHVENKGKPFWHIFLGDRLIGFDRSYTAATERGKQAESEQRSASALPKNVIPMEKRA